jgi:thioredoxin reductase
MRHLNTIVIGAGPTGVVLSYYLQQDGLDHIVLEKANQVGNSWEQVWENFALAMPVTELNLPGADLSHYPKNHRFKGTEMIALLKKYVVTYQLPILLNTETLPIQKTADGKFLVETLDTITKKIRQFTADNVVVCIGPRQNLKLPEIAKQLPKQLTSHSGEYKHARDFPKTQSTVLIVGSGLSALTIAHDLQKNSSHTVLLACGLNDKEVIANNAHLFQRQTLFMQELLPTQLVNEGVMNLGRLTGVKEQSLMFFHPAKLTYSLSLKLLDKIIFATGYEYTFQLLKNFPEILGTNKFPIHQQGTTQVKGLYVAGLQQNQRERTVTINQGSEDAKQVAQTIKAGQAKAVIRSKL